MTGRHAARTCCVENVIRVHSYVDFFDFLLTEEFSMRLVLNTLRVLNFAGSIVTLGWLYLTSLGGCERTYRPGLAS